MRPLAPDLRATNPRHRLVWLHTKQDPRPNSPAEAAPERLRKLGDPGETKNFYKTKEKIPSGPPRDRRMSGTKPELPAPASTLINCPLDLRPPYAPEGQV